MLPGFIGYIQSRPGAENSVESLVFERLRRVLADERVVVFLSGAMLGKEPSRLIPVVELLG